MALAQAGPTFYWLDSSEFVAASWTLGVAHAPGHPLMSLTARLFCWLPVGTIAFRVTLACAVEAAAATAIVALLALRLLDTAAGEPHRPLGAPRGGLTHLAVTVAALTAGWSYTLLFQAVRAEVYALNALCVLGATFTLARFGQLADRRYLLAAALLTGLGLCNHHLLMLLAVPAALLYLLVGVKRRPDHPTRWRRAAVGVLLAGSLGLCALAYLPLRAAQRPRVNWGAPTTVDRFAWVVSARGFHKAVDRATRESLQHRAGGALFALFGGLGAGGALIAFSGLYVGWRRQETRRETLLIAAVGGFNLLAPLLVGFDPFNPDAHGYLAVAVLAMAPGIALLIVGAGQALAQLSRWAPVATLLALALPALQLGELPKSDLSDHWDAEETARAMLAVPPGSLALTSYYGTVFSAWALQGVWDHRPDVAVVHRNFLGQPGYAEQQAQRHPELASQLTAWGKRRRLNPADLPALARRRPLRVQPDLNVSAAVSQRLSPAGLLFAYQAPRVDARRYLRWHLRRHLHLIAAWHDALGPLVENESRRAASWFHYLLARQTCAYGPTGAARVHLRALERLQPRAKLLAQLRRACRRR